MARIAALTLAVFVLVSVASAQEPSRIPAGPAGTVTLSRADYDGLLDLANRKPPAPEAAPVAASLTRADIRVRIAGASARATMRVDGEVFRPGTAKVMLIRNATLLDARMDNRPLPIVSEGGAHVALLSGPSTFSATLEVGGALVFSPGRASFTLPVPHAGSATATIDVPGEQAEVHVSGGLIQRRSSANGRTIVEATLTPGRPAEVWWNTHEAAPGNGAPRDLRLLSDVKSIVSIGAAEVRLVSLINMTVVQGAPSQIEVAIPDGYEIASVTGASLERSEAQGGSVTLHVADPAARRHQFLISLERANTGGSFKLMTGLPTVPVAQRETGEVAVEGLGTMEVTSPETPGLRRIDVRELDPAVASVARDSLLAAYRYQRAADEPPALTLDVRRFADAPVLAAVAERTVATTLVTTEGRALTEITMWLRNRAQPFMKVDLPQGASIFSVEVAGSPAKPVEGKDGSRVPLLRPGLQSDGLYVVSFVYLHAGTPFLKKGDMQMTLPKMDVPMNVVEWELFVPEQFRVDRFDGNMIAAGLVSVHYIVEGTAHANLGTLHSGLGGGAASNLGPLAGAKAGQINGRVVDSAGGALPGVTIVVEGAGQRQSVTSSTDGSYVVSNVPTGQVTVSAELQGFVPARRNLQFDQRGQQIDMSLGLGTTTETVNVVADVPMVNTSQSSTQFNIPMNNAQNNRGDDRAQTRPRVENEAPSVNVQNLQRRASGVLPVRVEVPRAGTSHRFIKPLVIDEETLVTFRYKRR